MLFDLIRLTFLAWLNGVDRNIGVVTETYFEFSLFQFPWQDKVVGLASRMTDRAVLVTEGYYTAPAHEIGHTYGLRLKMWPWERAEEYEMDNPPRSYGYWVNYDILVDGWLCFMNRATDRYRFTDRLGGRFICNDCFTRLFYAFIDPPAPNHDVDRLLVGGIVFKNGTLLLTPWYFSKNATISYPEPGNYSFIMLDYRDNVYNVSFAVEFWMLVEPYGALETQRFRLLNTLPQGGF